MRLLILTMAAAATLAVAAPSVVHAQARSLDELLRLVEQGRARDNQEAQQREQRFKAAQAEQQQLLRDARNRRAAEERRSEQLENTFDENELTIAEVSEQLDNRLGSLKELFGVLQQVSGDARGLFDSSLTNIEYPERSNFLTELAQKMGSTSELASIEEIERLWFELQREATELGKIKRLRGYTITNKDGEEQPTDIVRVGAFNLVADGRYLAYNPDTKSVSELQRQPEQGRFISSTSELLDASPGELVRFGIDPTRGQILATLVDQPNLSERIQQGGLVGYVIIALGLLGLLIALERLIVLGMAGSKVNAQLKSETPSDNNALGRVLMAYHDNKTVDTETLELKLGEAILKETPALQRSLLFLKII